MLYLSPIKPRFQGAFNSLEAAVAAVPSHLSAGYDNDDVVEVSYEAMCEVMPWDYPVIYWLQRLLPQARRILDAGGHMGTKYRAFGRYLELLNGVEWTVYDVPAIVRAGRKRAFKEGLTKLAFVDNLEGFPCPDIFLASGLLQYLDIPISDLLGRLSSLPDHLILNKVAMRDGDTVVTLENFGVALVPYQIRNRKVFLAEVEELGYRIEDEWEIPTLSRAINTHPELGHSQSAGFYLKRVK
jgi:putative methyltransferase (TIGR04325 family)